MLPGISRLGANVEDTSVILSSDGSDLFLAITCTWMKWTGLFGQVASHLAPLAYFRLGAGGSVSGEGVPPLLPPGFGTDGSGQTIS